jgi:hypothetical protein
MEGQCRSPSYLRLPGGRFVVHIIYVVRGRNHLIAWSVLSGGM